MALKFPKGYYMATVKVGEKGQIVIPKQARDMFDTLTEQMMKREGVTEELKEQNQIEWICRMGNIQERATEIVCSELIYA